MLEKVKEYYDETLQRAEKNISDLGVLTPTEYVEYLIRECLGVADFSMKMGLAFEDVSPLYEEISKNLKNLLTK